MTATGHARALQRLRARSGRGPAQGGSRSRWAPARCSSAAAAWMVRLGLARRALLGAAGLGRCARGARRGGLSARGRALGRLSAGGVAGGLEEHRRVAPRDADGAARRLGGGYQRRAARSWPTVPRRTTSRGAGPAVVEPLARPVRMLALGGLVVLGSALAAFTSAGPVRGPAAALWHPRRAWEATIAPVRLAGRRQSWTAGDPADLELEAIGRRSRDPLAPCARRGVEARGVRLDSLGHATVVHRPLQSDSSPGSPAGAGRPTRCWSGSGCRCFSASLSVTARYPGYLGLEAEPVPTGGDTLLLPAGTRLETAGEATAPLASAAWAAGGQIAIARGERRPASAAASCRRLGRVPPGAGDSRGRAARRRLGPAAHSPGRRQRAARRDTGAGRGYPGAAQPAECRSWSTCATTTGSPASCSRAAASAAWASCDSARRETVPCRPARPTGPSSPTPWI